MAKEAAEHVPAALERFFHINRAACTARVELESIGNPLPEVMIVLDMGTFMQPPE